MTRSLIVKVTKLKEGVKSTHLGGNLECKVFAKCMIEKQWLLGSRIVFQQQQQHHTPAFQPLTGISDTLMADWSRNTKKKQTKKNIYDQNPIQCMLRTS